MKVFHNRLTFIAMIAVSVCVVCFSGCGNGGKDENQIDEQIEDSSSNSSALIKIDNHLFSIPSPYQVAILIKQMNFEYNKEYLNPYNRSHSYITNFKKALNLGVYGANLGYLTMYEQSSESVQYFSVIKILMQEMNIESTFNKDLFKRIESNIGNKDSMLNLVSRSYRDIDQYLKDNNRNEVGVLILTGGWIESLYLMTNLATLKKNDELLRRIGEQKYPLDNLIKILSPYYNVSAEYATLIDGLIDLAYEYDGVDISYTYIPPTVQPDKKLTTVNSKSELVMSEQQFKTICDKIADIRKKIVE
jgi:hypothetical protein